MYKGSEVRLSIQVLIVPILHYSLTFIMFFNLALFSSLLLAPSILAVPAASGPRIARRRNGHQSQLSSYLAQPNGTVTNTADTDNWAGAVWAKGKVCNLFLVCHCTRSDPSSFNRELSILLLVPLPSPPLQAHKALLLLPGLVSMVTVVKLAFSRRVLTSPFLPMVLRIVVRRSLTLRSLLISLYHSRTAWYEWYPAPSYEFTNFPISAGDVIKLSVTLSSLTAGTITIENTTKNKVVTEHVTSTTPLCGQNAEWIVEDYMVGKSMVPFADFGTVTFTNAEASGTGDYTPSGATVLDIKQNGKVLTSTSVSGSSVTIKYV